MSRKVTPAETAVNAAASNPGSPQSDNTNNPAGGAVHGQEPRSGASQTQQRSARSVELDENLQGSVTLGPASPARAVGVTLVAGDAVRGLDKSKIASLPLRGGSGEQGFVDEDEVVDVLNASENRGAAVPRLTSPQHAGTEVAYARQTLKTVNERTGEVSYKEVVVPIARIKKRVGKQEKEHLKGLTGAAAIKAAKESAQNRRSRRGSFFGTYPHLIDDVTTETNERQVNVKPGLRLWRRKGRTHQATAVEIETVTRTRQGAAPDTVAHKADHIFIGQNTYFDITIKSPFHGKDAQFTLEVHDGETIDHVKMIIDERFRVPVSNQAFLVETTPLDGDDNQGGDVVAIAADAAATKTLKELDIGPGALLTLYLVQVEDHFSERHEHFPFFAMDALPTDTVDEVKTRVCQRLGGGHVGDLRFEYEDRVLDNGLLHENAVAPGGRLKVLPYRRHKTDVFVSTTLPVWRFRGKTYEAQMLRILRETYGRENGKDVLIECTHTRHLFNSRNMIGVSVVYRALNEPERELTLDRVQTTDDVADFKRRVADNLTLDTRDFVLEFHGEAVDVGTLEDNGIGAGARLIVRRRETLLSGLASVTPKRVKLWKSGGTTHEAHILGLVSEHRRNIEGVDTVLRHDESFAAFSNRSTFEIFVAHALAGHWTKFSLLVRSDKTIFDVKKLVNKRLPNARLNEIVLTYGSQRLADDDTVCDIGIKGRSTLILAQEIFCECWHPEHSWQKLSVLVQPNDTVRSVLDTLSQQAGVTNNMENQIVMFRDKVIRHTDTLAGRNVRPGALLKLPRQIYIAQCGEDNKWAKFPVPLFPKQTISELKDSIVKRTKVASIDQVLTWQGRRLKNTDTLGGVGVVPDTTLDLHREVQVEHWYPHGELSRTTVLVQMHFTISALKTAAGAVIPGTIPVDQVISLDGRALDDNTTLTSLELGSESVFQFPYSITVLHRSLAGDETSFSLLVPPGSIDSIRSRVEERLSDKSDSGLLLFFGHCEIKAGELLSDYGVRPHSVITASSSKKLALWKSKGKAHGALVRNVLEAKTTNEGGPPRDVKEDVILSEHTVMLDIVVEIPGTERKTQQVSLHVDSTTTARMVKQMTVERVKETLAEWKKGGMHDLVKHMAKGRELEKFAGWEPHDINNLELVRRVASKNIRLYDGITLEDVESGEHLMLCWVIKIEHYFPKLEKQNLELFVFPHETVECVKAEVSREIECECMDQPVMFNGEKLEDCNTLEEQGVRPNSTLDLMWDIGAPVNVTDELSSPVTLEMAKDIIQEGASVYLQLGLAVKLIRHGHDGFAVLVTLSAIIALFFGLGGGVLLNHFDPDRKLVPVEERVIAFGTRMICFTISEATAIFVYVHLQIFDIRSSHDRGKVIMSLISAAIIFVYMAWLAVTIFRERKSKDREKRSAVQHLVSGLSPKYPRTFTAFLLTAVVLMVVVVPWTYYLALKWIFPPAWDRDQDATVTTDVPEAVSVNASWLYAVTFSLGVAITIFVVTVLAGNWDQCLNQFFLSAKMKRRLHRHMTLNWDNEEPIGGFEVVATKQLLAQDGGTDEPIEIEAARGEIPIHRRYKFNVAHRKTATKDKTKSKKDKSAVDFVKEGAKEKGKRFFKKYFGKDDDNDDSKSSTNPFNVGLTAVDEHNVVCEIDVRSSAYRAGLRKGMRVLTCNEEELKIPGETDTNGSIQASRLRGIMDTEKSIRLKVWWGPTIIDNRGKNIDVKRTTIKTTVQDRIESKKEPH